MTTKQELLEMLNSDPKINDEILNLRIQGYYPSRCNVCGGGIRVSSMEKKLRLVEEVNPWWEYRKALIREDLCSMRCAGVVPRIEQRREQIRLGRILSGKPGDNIYIVPWIPKGNWGSEIVLSMHMDTDASAVYENPRSWEKDVREQCYFEMLMEHYNKEHGERCGHCKHFNKNKCHINPPEVFQEARQFGSSESHSVSSGWSILGSGKSRGESSSSSKWDTEFGYSTQSPGVSSYKHPCKDYVETRTTIPDPPVKPDFES